MGPHPAVAAIRLAVRRVLHDILTDHSPSPRRRRQCARCHGAPATSRPLPRAAPCPLVLVACSGGADSMALASAPAFEAPRLGVRAGGVTVDHGLQDGSDVRAAEVVAAAPRACGLDPVEAVAVAVGRDGGPEAAARDARYAALDAAAERHGAAAVLLGHTRDDQAETVLLGLARGSGTRSLSGMAAVSGAAAATAAPSWSSTGRPPARPAWPQAIPVWDDPHNADPAYTRSRVRHEGLPALEKALGKGVVEALARTAAALPRRRRRARRVGRRAPRPTVRRRRRATGVRRSCYALPPAVRRRVLRRAAIAAGAPAGSLFARHIEEVDRLITGWRGQGAINLPGRVAALERQGGRLVIRQG